MMKLLCGILMLLTFSTSLCASSRYSGSNSQSTTVQTQSFFTTPNNCILQRDHILPIPNGVLVISCLWQQKQVDERLLMQLPELGFFQLDWRQFIGVWNKTLGYFRRDSFVAICLLKCSTGEPFSRLKFIGNTSITEPKRLNIGCDDWWNMECRTTCPDDVSRVENGDITCTEGVYNRSKCTLKCKPGYTPVGTTTKICKDLRWLPDLPFLCEAIPTCSTPQPIENGQISCSADNILLSQCSVTCNYGYRLVGPTQTLCLQSGDDRVSWYWLHTNDYNHTTPVILRDGEQRCEEEESTSETGVVSGSGLDLSSYNHTTSSLLNGSNPILKRYAVCDVAIRLRQACGNRLFTRKQCEQNRCCWDPVRGRPIKCYNPASDPINQALKGDKATQQRYMQAQNSGGSYSHFANTVSTPTTSLRPTATTNRVNYHPIPAVAHPLSSVNCGCPSPQSSFNSHDTCYKDEGCPNSINRRCRSLPFRQSSTSLHGQSSNVAARIFCGNSTTAENWPWNALVYFNGQICGGTLIAPQYVITAGHCLLPSDGSMDTAAQNYVFLGVTNTTRRDPATQGRHILKVERHPNFTLTSRGYAINDIAIIKMLTPADVSGKFVRPLCLPHARVPQLNDVCFIVGFGKTSPTTIRTPILQKAKVPLVSFLECLKYFAGFIKPGQNLCAGSTLPNKADTCKGDSGGPLVCKRAGTSCDWFLTGITSFGRDPCGQAAPSVYVNVFHYQRWIYAALQRLASVIVG